MDARRLIRYVPHRLIGGSLPLAGAALWRLPDAPVQAFVGITAAGLAMVAGIALDQLRLRREVHRKE